MNSIHVIHEYVQMFRRVGEYHKDIIDEAFVVDRFKVSLFRNLFSRLPRNVFAYAGAARLPMAIPDNCL